MACKTLGNLSLTLRGFLLPEFTRKASCSKSPTFGSCKGSTKRVELPQEQVSYRRAVSCRHETFLCPDTVGYTLPKKARMA